MKNLEEFRTVLDQAGYTASNLATILGPEEFLPGDPINTRYFHYRAGQGGRTGILIRLFLTNTGVPVEDAREALAPIPLEQWEEAGFLEPAAGGLVRGRVRLQAVDPLILAVDLAEDRHRVDLVMGLTQASLLLANFTIRRPVDTFLDIGAGSGLQALLAARHAREVVATDLSPRAVEFARFNSGLNLRPNVCCVQGSLFEPVAGRRFDQIVTNPPFFISPSTNLLFRDSGMHLDSMLRQIIRQAPEHLNDGGYCQLLGNWVHLKGEDWKQRLLSWQQASGCDMWVLRTEVLDPAAYARNWIQETQAGKDDPFDEWMAFYERENVEAIGFGMIALRRSGRSTPWSRVEEFTPVNPGPFGAAVETGFRLTDFVRDTSDEALGEVVLRAAPDLELRQAANFDQGRWLTESAEIRLKDGLRFTGGVDQNSLRLITACDGKRTFGEVLAQFPPGSWPTCIKLVRGLLWRGFLLPWQAS